MKEVTAVLKKTALFKNLDAETLRRLAALAVEQNLSANAILFVSGEASRGLFVIAAGAVRGFRTGADGREQTIYAERAPATIAEVPVFDDGAYFSTVVAEEETRLFFIEKTHIRALCLENPQFALAALRIMARRVRNLAALVEEIALCEVGERLVHFLLSEAGQSDPDRKREVSVKLNLTRAQIAARIGTVREVVSRNLTHLRMKGLIRFEDRCLIIPDREKLSRYVAPKKH